MIAKKLKKVFENKKRPSKKDATCFKRVVCYNNYMLKTISYSIVFVSTKMEEIQEGKNILINKNDVFFNNLDNALFLQYLLRDITKNNDITITEDKNNNNTNTKIYHVSNKLDIVLNFPVKMIIQYTAEDIQICKCEEIKNIALNLITKIKSNNDNNVVSRIGLNQDYCIECENADAFEKLQKIITLKDDSIVRSVLSFVFNEDGNPTLNMSIYNKIEDNNRIFINTNLESKITSDDEIESIINNTKNNNFIKSKIDLVLSLLK